MLRGVSALQTIITLIHADASYHTHRHRSLWTAAEEHEEAASLDKGKQAGLRCRGTKGCEKQSAKKARDMRARDGGFLSSLFPSHSLCCSLDGSGLLYPQCQGPSGRGAGGAVWKQQLTDCPSKTNCWYAWQVHRLYSCSTVWGGCCVSAVLLSRSFVLRLFSFEAKGLFSLYFFMTFKKQCFFWQSLHQLENLFQQQTNSFFYETFGL